MQNSISKLSSFFFPFSYLSVCNCHVYCFSIFFFDDLVSSDLSPSPWARLSQARECPVVGRGEFLPPTCQPPVALTCNWWLPNQGLHCQTRDFWGSALGLCSPSPTFASKQLLCGEHCLSSGQLQDERLHQLCSAACWAQLQNPAQTPKCSQGFSHFFQRMQRLTSIRHLYTKTRMNNERRRPKSALLGKKMVFFSNRC